MAMTSGRVPLLSESVWSCIEGMHGDSGSTLAGEYRLGDPMFSAEVARHSFQVFEQFRSSSNEFLSFVEAKSGKGCENEL